MRAHRGVWKFFNEIASVSNFRLRRTYYEECRGDKDSDWLTSNAGLRLRDRWLKLSDGERKRRMQKDKDPSFPPENTTGFIDGRKKEKKRPRRRATKPSKRRGVRMRCGYCFALFWVAEGNDPPAATKSPKLVPSPSAPVDNDGEQGADRAARHHQQSFQLGIANMVFKGSLAIDFADGPDAATCWPGLALPTASALAGELLDKVHDDLRSQVVKELSAAKHVVLRVMTDYGAAGGLDDARDGRVTILLCSAQTGPVYWTSFPMISTQQDASSPSLSGTQRRQTRSARAATGGATAKKISEVITDVSQLLGGGSAIVATVTDGSEIDKVVAVQGTAATS